MDSPDTRARISAIDAAVVEQARAELRALRREPWFREGSWAISKHNFLDETRPPESVARRITLIDITGRVIEQVPGVALTAAEKISLARALSEAGVTCMHMGLGMDSPEIQAHVRAVTAAGLPIKVVACIYSKQEVEASVRAGAHVVEIRAMGLPGLHGSYYGERMGSEAAILDSVVERIRLTKALGAEAQADINGVAYADVGYIRRYVTAAAAAGADYVYLLDSTGGLGPAAYRYLVKVVKETAPTVRVGLHLHNDFGLALANALAGLEAGAELFDVSINGTGERAGQLDLAQMAVNSTIFYGVETGIQLDRLYPLSRLVQDLTRAPLPGTWPIVGEYALSSAVEGVHRQEHFVDPAIHMPITPALLGRRLTFHLGRHTGRFGLLTKAEELGLSVAEGDVPELLIQLERWFELHKRLISDDEVRDLLIRHGCEPERRDSADAERPPA